MLFFSPPPPPPPPPLSSLPSWSLLPCCLIGRATLGKIAGISFHRSPRLSTRVMSCLFGIMHSRRSRSPQTPRLPPSPLWMSGSTAEICALSQRFAHAVASSSLWGAERRRYARAPARRSKFPHAAAMQVTQEGRKGSLEWVLSVFVCLGGWWRWGWGLSQAFIGS